MSNYKNIHSSDSDPLGNEYFVQIPDSSRFDLSIVDNVSNALTVSSAWQKIFESPKTEEPNNERGAGFVDAGRKLDFAIISNESNETALIDMFFVGHTNRMPLYYPSQTNVYENKSTVMVNTVPKSDGVFGVRFSNVSEENGSVLKNGRRALLYQLNTPGGEERISGMPAGSIPGLKSDDNWEYLSDTVSDSRILAFPITNNHVPYSDHTSRKLMFPACQVSLWALSNGNQLYWPGLENADCIEFEITQPTINHQAWHYDHPEDYNSSDYDENSLNRADQIDELINLRDASGFDIVFHYFMGRILSWDQSWKNLNNSILDSVHSSMGSFAVATKNSTSCLLYTSPSPRDATLSRMPSSA